MHGEMFAISIFIVFQRFLRWLFKFEGSMDGKWAMVYVIWKERWLRFWCHMESLHRYKVYELGIAETSFYRAWWSHQMETFSALLALCAWNSPVTAEFPSQRPMTRSFDVFFDLFLNKRWVNNRETGDLRRYRTHYDVTVMLLWLVACIWANMSKHAPQFRKSICITQYQLSVDAHKNLQGTLTSSECTRWTVAVANDFLNIKIGF